MVLLDKDIFSKTCSTLKKKNWFIIRLHIDIPKNKQKLFQEGNILVIFKLGKTAG